VDLSQKPMMTTTMESPNEMARSKVQSTATAHQSWDRRWQSESGRDEWLNPDPRVVRFVQARRDAGAHTALDLGCGVGRHSLALARLGFVTTAFDASLAGLEYTRAAAEEEGLALIFERGNMTNLGFPDASFDYVLSLNVIYHGDATVVRQTLSEVHRVLKPGGFFQATMLSKRNARYGGGEEIAPNTFVKREGDGDKDHPHFYCNARELTALFDAYEILSLEDVEQKGPGTWHWYVTAEAR
jgi:tellurite methyltransferase